MLLDNIPLSVLKVREGSVRWRSHSTADHDYLFEGIGTTQSLPWWDAATYRDILLRTKSREDVSRFLSIYGNPGLDRFVYHGTTTCLFNGKPFTWIEHGPELQQRVFLRRFKEAQAEIRKVMELPVERLLSDPRFDLDDIQIDLKLEGNKLTAECRITNGILACLASVFFDKVADIEYGWCAYCEGPFVRTTRRRKVYCKRICAQRAATKAFRDRRAAKFVKIKVGVRQLRLAK